MRDWRWREGSSPLRRRRVIIDVNGAPVVGSHHSPTVREVSGNDGGGGGGGDGDGGGGGGGWRGCYMLAGRRCCKYGCFRVGHEGGTTKRASGRR